MPKPVNCCVPGCNNNFRNTTGLHYYRIPKDRDVRKEYVRLIRNKTLKLDSDNTRICSSHFEGGKKKDRKHLPSIFPWSKVKQSRRPLQRKQLNVNNESYTSSELEGNASSDQSVMTTTTTSTEPSPVDIDENTYIHTFERQGSPEASDYQPTFVDSASQTDLSDCISSEHENTIRELNETIEKLSCELKRLQHQLKENRFDIEIFKNSPSDIAFYTGFQDYETLLLCYSLVEDTANNLNYGSYIKQTDDNKLGRKRKMSCFNEFTLVAMKLRLGLFNRDIAHRFSVSESTVSLTFRTWIRFLRLELEPLIQLPPREVLRQHLPPLFQLHHPNTALIIDCTEFEMERPSALDNQSACYSQYKSRTTMKALIGITPSGATAFASELYPGSISDKEIVKRSGLLDILQPGDEIMADKGFLIKDELASVQATLVMPKFLQARKQFTKHEAEHNKRVASLRVHVERCMERIRNWHILDRRIPISLAPFASDIVIVLSAFTNFSPPLIS